MTAIEIMRMRPGMGPAAGSAEPLSSTASFFLPKFLFFRRPAFAGRVPRAGVVRASRPPLGGGTSFSGATSPNAVGPHSVRPFPGGGR